MTANNLLIDGFTRIKDVVHRTVEDLSEEHLAFKPSKDANTIAWLVWHLSRVQDDHIASVADKDQEWYKGWSDKFKLPFERSDTGYGHSSQEVASVRVSSEILLGYHDAVFKASVAFIKKLKEKDYERVVDTRWNPPVTLSVRMVSIISDDLQHAGQAAYVKGLLKKH